MTHNVSRLTQVAVSTLFLLLSGATAALAGPAPIEPEAPPPPVEVTGGFPWLVTSAAVALAVIAVVLVAALWHRAHDSHPRLVTP
jgi:hypothetical protein